MKSTALISSAMLCALLFCAGLIQAEQPKSPNPLVGEWVIEQYLDDNQDRMQRLGGGTPKLIVTPEEMYLVNEKGRRFGGNDLTNIGWSTYKLGEKDGLKTLDIDGTVQGGEGKKKPVVYPAIYKLEGDQLTIAYQETRGEQLGRPKEFVSNGDANMLVCKRVGSQAPANKDKEK